jgi:hypothetical protein
MQHANQRFPRAKQVLERHLVAVTVLVVAVVIVYHNALAAYFFDDDFQWLVTSWSFHPGQLVAFSSMSHFYRPVIDVYFAVMTPLLGGSPMLFHAASVALHLATVLVVYALSRRLWGPPASGPSALFGFLTALFFAVQPSDIDAVAWVGALAEAIGALFGCLSLLWFLRWRDSGEARWRLLSVIAFALALLTHESSVVFLPVLFLADWLIWRRQKDLPSAFEVRPFIPYVVVTSVYLALDLWINSRNYVVSQGHYTIGFHIVGNALDYIDALYVGRRDSLNYTVIGAGVVVLLVRGSDRVRFATCWMLLALAPFLSFNWGNTSRYLYQPAIGFSLLLAEGVMQLRRVRSGGARSSGFRFAGSSSGFRFVGSGLSRTILFPLIVAVIAIRFAVFAHSNVRDFARRTEVYPEYLARFRETHGDIPSHSVVDPDPAFAAQHPHQFANAALQWEYRDPTISIRPY